MDSRPTCTHSDCGDSNELNRASSPSQPVSKSSPASSEQDCQIIFKQIVSMEVAFHRHMNIMQQRFVEPLEHMSKGVLTNEEYSYLFDPIIPIVDFTKFLSRQLNKEIDFASFVDPDTPPDLSAIVPKVFSSVVKAIQRWYGNYCANKAKIDKKLERLMTKKRRFRAILQRLTSHPGCDGLPLQSYFFMPVKHICQYPLLFQKAVEAMPLEHAHRKQCVDILTALRKTASDVDCLPCSQPVPKSSPESSESKSTDEDNQFGIFNEIVYTEKLFHQHMNTVHQRFVLPLKHIGKNVLTDKEHSSLFDPLVPIMDFSKMLSQQLSKDIECASFVNPTGQPDLSTIVPEAFARMIKAMQPLYGNYCASKAKMDATLERLASNNKRFKAMLEKLNSHPECGGLPLQSFLIMPVQRICQYPLLFEKVVEVMSPEHTHRKKCVDILTALRETASDIDSCVSHRKESLKINTLLRRLSTPLPRSLCIPAMGDTAPLPVGEEIVLHRKFLAEHRVSVVMQVSRPRVSSNTMIRCKKGFKDPKSPKSPKSRKKMLGKTPKTPDCPRARKGRIRSWGGRANSIKIVRHKIRLLVFTDVMMLASRRVLSIGNSPRPSHGHSSILKVLSELRFAEITVTCDAANHGQLHVVHRPRGTASDVYSICLDNERLRNQVMHQIGKFADKVPF